ncbi:hypothetical protein DICPUDRAFT_155013 [Dictyostelium purpureum]|uniref:Carbohydrate binding domain-containing protein n=1 Tax=Dictyostelium purpureum TaxID=5786 RepID=F0ZSU6_DICPU|nr:uncharacterized protein DICPUDRAFT_155013 [Dictyostelium purpureum]EGC32983.1 hypothetical protein DICPUDRAFT_155013 [Dictyostelium purpureum]|eukprot:XP_003290501.1 hypothetical protein DICPUDRAFT_155013 [Dictyostelium purpureum]
MKLLLLLVLTVLINYVQSQLVSITPYVNSCSESESFGIGYQLPVSECLTIGDNSLYLVLSNDKQVVRSYWLPNCTTPLDFGNAIEFTYNINSCNTFKIPYTAGLLSSISLNATIPNQAIVYNYYYESSGTKCLGPSYKVFYTNNYSFDDQNEAYNKYTCTKNEPSLYTCNRNGECETENLGGGCQNNWYSVYPYIVTC